MIYKESRPIKFKTDESNSLFAEFNSELLSKMANEDLALHAHDYVIAQKTYNID